MSTTTSHITTGCGTAGWNHPAAQTTRPMSPPQPQPPHRPTPTPPTRPDQSPDHAGESVPVRPHDPTSVDHDLPHDQGVWYGRWEPPRGPNNPTYEPTATATTPPSHPDPTYSTPQTRPDQTTPGNPSRCDHTTQPLYQQWECVMVPHGGYTVTNSPTRYAYPAPSHDIRCMSADKCLPREPSTHQLVCVDVSDPVAAVSAMGTCHGTTR